MASLPSQIFSLLLKENSNVPTIRGLATAEAVKTVFAQLQNGNIDRKQLSDEKMYTDIHSTARDFHQIRLQYEMW